MRGFIVDETYRIEHDKAYVYLFGRLENGESFCTISHFEPYFTIKTSDVDKAGRLPSTIPFRIEKVDWISMAGDPVSKVVVDVPNSVSLLKKLFQNNRIICYEADIRFTNRFLMDRDILRTLDIEGSYEQGDCVSRIYKEPKIKPAEWYPRLRVLSFDIETSPDAKRLYSISMVCRDKGHEKREVLIISTDKSLKNAVIFPDEQSLLEHFRKTVLKLDPDIITGWNSIDFDLQVLRDKFRHYKIPFRMARMDWDCRLRIESSFTKESTADFPGRQVLDGIQMLKLNFISLPNYKLQTASEELLGEKKLIEGGNKGQQIVDAYEKDTQKLVDYNLKDSELVLDILDKTNAVDIMINRAMLTGMSLERVRGSIASFDSLYLRALRKRKVVGPSGGFADKEEGITGGYVMEGKPGIYDYVVVCDFKSLYPSVMRTFNIDPLAYELGKKAENPNDKKKWVTAPNGAVFSSEQAILPDLLQKLWAARDKAKEKKDEHASFAIKILMNSFFGVLAAPACRFFSMDIGNAITTFAQKVIKLSIEQAEERGFDVIYGDTDSVFLDVKCKSHDEALAIAEKLSGEVNLFYKSYVKEGYERTSFLELEPDKIFIHFIMPRVRGSKSGAKKRYAGTILKDGKEELSITGMETVRRDWTDLAKTFQQKLLYMAFAKEDPSQFIRQFVKYLQEGQLDHELIYVKALRKDTASYVKTTPPHVKAARLLEENDVKLESNLINYVMTTEGPYPVQLLKRPGAPSIDYDHYAEKQLKPIADAILVFFNANFDDVMKGSSQSTLGQF